jgi:hypothetical protein
VARGENGFPSTSYRSGIVAMTPDYVPAVAALAGSAIGGLTSFASAWLNQARQDRATRLSQDKARRQKLYRQFIDEASKLYADALVHDQVEISALVSVYALVGRMRVLSSPAVIETRKRSFAEVHKLMSSHAMDPLRAFSEHCREDLSNPQSLLTAGLKRAMK